MTTLYELADARAVLDALIDEAEGELTPAMEAALDASTSAFEEKLERCALWIREQMADCEVIRAEEQRLQARRHAKFTATERLRVYMREQMRRVDMQKMVGLKATVSLRDNPPAIHGELSQAALAALYQQDTVAFVKEVPAAYTLDRRALLAAIRAGSAPLPDGLTMTVDQSITIR